MYDVQNFREVLVNSQGVQHLPDARWLPPLHLTKDETCPEQGVRPVVSGEKIHIEICFKPRFHEMSVNEVTKVKTGEVEYRFVLENAKSQTNTVTLDIGVDGHYDRLRGLENCIDELTWTKSSKG